MARGATTAEQQARPTQPSEEPEREEPELTFPRYAIAFHLAAVWCGEDEQGPSGKTSRDERAMESYEDDMLLHAHRGDAAPFRTLVVPTAMGRMTVGFGPMLTYEAEGKKKEVRCFGATEDGRTRTFRVALAQTTFTPTEPAIPGRREARPAILSLVLTPLEPPSEDSELNEYDVIKLVKLWEGGEGVADAPSAIVEGTDLWFATQPRERLTLHHLAAREFRGWRPLEYEHPGRAQRDDDGRLRRITRRLPALRRATAAFGSSKDVVTTARDGYRVGTVELELPSSCEWRQELFRDIAILKTRREAPKVDTKRRNRVVAVGGILQGLLDFREITDDELADVFADVDVDAEDATMRAFHKGTLLSLSGEDDQRPSPIGVDPYLAVPNIVLLHDEQRLKTARLREQHLSLRQRGPLRQWHARAAIAETENGLGEMARLLAQHPNVFHYSNERRLQKRGRQSRGLDDLEAFMRLRMEDLSSVLQWRVRRRDRWTAVLGIAVGVVTAFLVQQAIEGKPLWLIVLAAVALFGVFLWLRDRLF